MTATPGGNRVWQTACPLKLSKALLAGRTPFAFIDVREAGEYNTSHIPGSSLMSRSAPGISVAPGRSVQRHTRDSLDDDGRRVPPAAATVERMGYRQVSVLDGGINRWVSRDYPTEWGSNVPSKDFGEKVEVVHHVPELEATELHERMARGDKLVILDTRTPEEYQRFCIPGGRSAPGENWPCGSPTSPKTSTPTRPLLSTVPDARAASSVREFCNAWACGTSTA